MIVRFLALTALIGTPAFAADDPPGDITVTAQKREQAAGSIGVALTALAGDDLRLLGRQDTAALARQVPGLQVQAYSPTLTVFNIRGVSQNDYADSQEAPIAFYDDEVYVSALGAISGMAYDLERIEVLRGPQGTVFGRNATGGLVQYVSAKPTDALDAYATLTAGSFGQIASEGAIGGPLSSAVRARFAYSVDTHDGYIANRSGDDLGDARFYAGRLQIAADVAPGHELTLKLQGMRNADERSGGLYSHAAAAPDARGLGRFIGADENPFGTCGGCDALGYREPDDDPFTGAFSDPVRFDRRFVAATARYVGDLGGATLTAITDYQRLRKDYAEDSDMSPASTLTGTAAQRLSQASQEVRLAGSSGAIEWLVGGYGVRIRSRNAYVVDATGSLGIREEYGGRLATDSLAAFAQGEYAIAPAWRVVAGLRYTHDWKRYDYAHAENGVIDLRFDPVTQPGLADRAFGGWSGKAEIDYHPSDALLLYASYDRGTKSGGYSAPALPPADPTSIAFDAETLDSYAIGAKASLWGGRARIAVTAFHYAYHGYQAFELVDLALAVRNKDARTNGLEVQAEVRPAAGLELRGSLALLDAVVKRVILPIGETIDRRMPQAPRVSTTGLVRYGFALGGGTATITANVKYDGEQYLSTFNAEVDRAGPRAVGDLRLSYALPSRAIELAVFANNVTDQRYKLFNLDFSTSFGFAQTAYARPRWIGATVTLRPR